MCKNSQQNQQGPTTAEQRKAQVMNNRKRGLRFSRNTFKNKMTVEQLQQFWEQNETTETQDFYLMKLRSSLTECCHHSLWREYSDKNVSFIGAHTCKHKYCHVCNAERSKIVRKQYYNFFEKNPDLLQNYDFMHLTLTVPHTSNGWRNKQFYADEIIKEFNFMRKKTFWKKRVYAGEFGLEVTKNQNGLHIHIHSMLLVYKSKQNRNELHKEILKAWSNQTSGSNARLHFTESDIAAIKKSNKLITDIDIKKINPTGATLVGLESLYIKSENKKPGFHYSESSGFYKKYVTPSDGFESFMFGVMECLKYHFQPLAMMDNGQVNFPLMLEVLPMIYGKSLYQRFGAFHAATNNAHPDCRMLSNQFKEVLSETQLHEEVERIIEDNAEPEVIHPETLQPCPAHSYSYVIMSIRNVYFDASQNLKPIVSSTAQKQHLQSAKMVDSLRLMLDLTLKLKGVKRD